MNPLTACSNSPPLNTPATGLPTATPIQPWTGTFMARTLPPQPNITQSDIINSLYSQSMTPDNLVPPSMIPSSFSPEACVQHQMQEFYSHYNMSGENDVPSIVQPPFALPPSPLLFNQKYTPSAPLNKENAIKHRQQTLQYYQDVGWIKFQEVV